MNRELDVQVAEALGWRKIEITEKPGAPIWVWSDPVLGPRVSVELWNPSTDIAAAWSLVEQHGGEFYLERAESKHGDWMAMFDDELGDAEFAPTAPEAICRAFLATKEW